MSKLGIETLCYPRIFKASARPAKAVVQRKLPSAQNSISTGRIRMPPQNGGRGGFGPLVTPTLAASAIRCSREESGWDCWLAQAPRRDFRLRLAK